MPLPHRPKPHRPLEPLVAFYYGAARDSEGRTLAGILRCSDEWFELTHDYIQWLFPLAERSRAVVGAPVATPAVVAAFHADPLLQQHLRGAFLRMLAFYGLAYQGGAVAPAYHWAARKPVWFLEDTHNNLRLTRILKSLCLLGLRPEALALHAALEKLREEPDCGLGERAFEFWRAAVAPEKQVKS